MLSYNKEGVKSPSFSPITIETDPAVPVEQLENNIRLSSARGLPFLLNYKYDLKNEPLAIVGGGPSLKNHLLELHRFNRIMVVSTAHDYLVERGIVPIFSVICDQVPETENFSHKQDGCTYLIATQCDPIIFDHFTDYAVKLWDMDGWVDEKQFSGRGRISGGSSAAMRAPALAYILGFRDLHFFGIDSSFDDDAKRHIYNTKDERLSRPFIECRINGQTFKTTLPMLRQAQDFQELMTNYGHMFSITVYGDGLLKAVWQDMKEKHDLVFKQEVING